MYYYTKTSLRVTPHLRIIYGSWDPRHAGSPVNTAGLAQIALLLVHHAALQRCCFHNRTFSSFPRSPAPFVLHHLSPISYKLLPEAGLLPTTSPLPSPPSRLPIVSLSPSASTCLLPSSSQTLSSSGPQPPWVLCASGAGPLLTHPCHPHPHFFASRLFPDMLPLANTHCEFSTLPGLAPVPPSPSRHIRAHTGLPPASSA